MVVVAGVHTGWIAGLARGSVEDATQPPLAERAPLIVDVLRTTVTKLGTTGLSGAAEGWTRSAWVAVLAWLATRVILELIAGWGFRLDGHAAPWLHFWVQWDASYYLDVAREGYRIPDVVTGNETGQSGLNFFPLLPMGIAFTGLMVGPPIVAGLLFDNVCLVAAAAFLHRLTTRRVSAVAADWAVLSLMLVPGSFALSGIMTEAPFLLFSTAAATFAGRRPAWAAASLSLLGLVKLTGVILLAGHALDWLIARLRGRPASYRLLCLLALSPLLLLVYAIYMFHVTGDALAAVHTHQAFWSLHPGWPFQDLFLFVDTDQQRLQVESIVALSMVAILLARWRLFTPGEWLFLAISIQTSTSALSLSPSLIRYMIGLYPLHMALGDLCSRYMSGRLALCAYAMIEGAMVVFWTHGSDLYQ